MRRAGSTCVPTGSVGYLYNGEGERVASTENSKRTDFVLDSASSPDVVLQENSTDENNNPTTVTYAYGLGLISRKAADGSVTYMLTDANGSVRAETDANGQISVSGSHSYDAFGNEQGSPTLTGNRFRYAGQYADIAGLTYMRARFYDPQIGAFLSVDPIPTASSPYAYCGDNPMVASDPTGEHWYDTLVAGLEGAGNFIAGFDNAATFGLLGHLGLGAPFHGPGLECSYTIGELDFGAVATVASAGAYGEVWAARSAAGYLFENLDAAGAGMGASVGEDLTAADLAGRTPAEIRQLAAELGYEPHGLPDAEGNFPKFRDPVTKVDRLRIDRGHTDKVTGAPYRSPTAAVPHVHGYDSSGASICDPVTGDRHFPLR